MEADGYQAAAVRRNRARRIGTGGEWLNPCPIRYDISDDSIRKGSKHPRAVRAELHMTPCFRIQNPARPDYRTVHLPDSQARATHVLSVRCKGHRLHAAETVLLLAPRPLDAPHQLAIGRAPDFELIVQPAAADHQARIRRECH